MTLNLSPHLFIALKLKRSARGKFWEDNSHLPDTLNTYRAVEIFHRLEGKISAQPHPALCTQFLDRENNDKNNTLPLRKQICFTVVWGCAEI